MDKVAVLGVFATFLQCVLWHWLIILVAKVYQLLQGVPSLVEELHDSPNGAT